MPLVAKVSLPGIGSRIIALSVDKRLLDRKSTRLNSSHLVISYAVFCLKEIISGGCLLGGPFLRPRHCRSATFSDHSPFPHYRSLRISVTHRSRSAPRRNSHRTSPAHLQ